jgi:hypothetical protein
MPVYFCDKASPWQRPSNENTNGLLRQYFLKGSDLRAHGPDDLAAVAAGLNARPRKVLGWDTPAARSGLGTPAVASASGRPCDDGLRARHATPLPEPPAGPPGIQFKPGMASDLLRELAPRWPRKASTWTTSTCPARRRCSGH